jgi:MSV199 domain
MNVFEFIKYKKIDTTPFIFGIYWHSICSNSLIYISDTLTQCMGYTSNDISERKRDIKKRLLCFELNKEYFDYSTKEYEQFLVTYKTNYKTSINQSVSNIKLIESIGDSTVYPPVDYEHSNIRHLLLTNTTLKEVMIMIGTNQAKEVRRYLMSLDQVLLDYYAYMRDTTVKQIEVNYNQLKHNYKKVSDQLIIEKKKSLHIVSNAHTLEKNEYIYIATTDQCKQFDQYKIGRTTDIKSIYQCDHTNDNLYYCHIWKCHNSMLLQSLISELLKQYSISMYNEMYVFDYSKLIYILNNIIYRYELNVDLMNDMINNGLSSYNIPHVTPDRLIDIDGVKYNNTLLITSYVTDSLQNNTTLSNNKNIHIESDDIDMIDSQDNDMSTLNNNDSALQLIKDESLPITTIAHIPYIIAVSKQSLLTPIIYNTKLSVDKIFTIINNVLDNKIIKWKDISRLTKLELTVLCKKIYSETMERLVYLCIQ